MASDAAGARTPPRTLEEELEEAAHAHRDEDPEVFPVEEDVAHSQPATGSGAEGSGPDTRLAASIAQYIQSTSTDRATRTPATGAFPPGTVGEGGSTRSRFTLVDPDSVDSSPGDNPAQRASDAESQVRFQLDRLAQQASKSRRYIREDRLAITWLDERVQTLMGTVAAMAQTINQLRFESTTVADVQANRTAKLEEDLAKLDVWAREAVDAWSDESDLKRDMALALETRDENMKP